MPKKNVSHDFPMKFATAIFRAPQEDTFAANFEAQASIGEADLGEPALLRLGAK